jgi:hypothetical protein
MLLACDADELDSRAVAKISIPYSMEMTQLIFTGALTAVLASVFNAVVLPSLTRLREKAKDAWREPSGSAQFATLSVHLCAGVGLGVLFWLTWGLAAVVGVPWWLRGVLFGTAIWCAVCRCSRCS